jgi:hypothetical protein
MHPYAVDERLVMPETPFEILDGEVFHVPGADPPHAGRHSKVSALLEIYAAPEFKAASDMLTRTSATSDFAPDASIYPRAVDPVTGGRQIEELAFEIVSKTRLSRATRKAAKLTKRGVRRVFAIDLKRERALEWSRVTKSWEILGPDAVIDDPTLVLPLPVRELVTAAAADDAVARALLAKRNPVLVTELARSHEEGKRLGRHEERVEAVLEILRVREIPVDAASERQIRAAELTELARMRSAAITCTSVRKLLAARRPKARKRQSRE